MYPVRRSQDTKLQAEFKQIFSGFKLEILQLLTIKFDKIQAKILICRVLRSKKIANESTQC